MSTWDKDQPLPEDDQIQAANPLRTGRHDLYVDAMRLVSAKKTKGALVEMVNWLLARHADVVGRNAWTLVTRDREMAKAYWAGTIQPQIWALEERIQGRLRDIKSKRVSLFGRPTDAHAMDIERYEGDIAGWKRRAERLRQIANGPLWEPFYERKLATKAGAR